MRRISWALLGLAGCGPMYGFELTSPDWPLSEGDVVLYRIVESAQVGEAGGIDLVCDGDLCRSRTGHGSDEIAAGSVVLVWVDVDGDDWDEWRAVPDAPISALEPDPQDPRGEAVWTRGPGVRQLEIELTLP